MIRETIEDISSIDGTDLYIYRDGNENNEHPYYVGENEPTGENITDRNKYNIKEAYRYDVKYSSDLFPEVLKQIKTDFTVTTNDGLVLLKYDGSKYVLYDMISSYEIEALPEDTYSGIAPEENSELDFKYNQVYELHQEPFPMSMRTIRFEQDDDGNFYHPLRVLKVDINRVLVHSDYDFDNTFKIKIRGCGENIIIEHEAYKDQDDNIVAGFYWLSGKEIMEDKSIIDIELGTDISVEMNSFKYKPYYSVQMSENNDFSNKPKNIIYTSPDKKIDYISISDLILNPGDNKVMRII